MQDGFDVDFNLMNWAPVGYIVCPFNKSGYCGNFIPKVLVCAGVRVKWHKGLFYRICHQCHGFQWLSPAAAVMERDRRRNNELPCAEQISSHDLPPDEGRTLMELPAGSDIDEETYVCLSAVYPDDYPPRVAADDNRVAYLLGNLPENDISGLWPFSSHTELLNAPLDLPLPSSSNTQPDLPALSTVQPVAVQSGLSPTLSIVTAAPLATPTASAPLATPTTSAPLATPTTSAPLATPTTSALIGTYRRQLPNGTSVCSYYETCKIKKVSSKCDRFCCKRCCEVRGGCTYHRLPAGSALVAPVGAQPLQSSQVVNGAPYVVPQYRSPMSPEFRDEWKNNRRQQQIAAENKKQRLDMEVALAHSVEVYMWLKDNEAFKKHTEHSISTWPMFKLSSSSAILEKLGIDSADSVQSYKFDLRSWEEERLDLPIRLSKDQKIFLRLLGVTCCHGFNSFVGQPSSPQKRRQDDLLSLTHLAPEDQPSASKKPRTSDADFNLPQLTTDIPHPITSISDIAVSPTNPTFTEPAFPIFDSDLDMLLQVYDTFAPAGPPHAPNLTTPPSPSLDVRPAIPVRWTSGYTCDIAAGLEYIQSQADAADTEKGDAKRAAFATVFKSSTYIKASVDRHLAVWRSASLSTRKLALELPRTNAGENRWIKWYGVHKRN